MSFTSLPTELIFPIADNLFLHDLNSLIRTSSRLAILLTPQLYNKAFNPARIYDECNECTDTPDDEFVYIRHTSEGKIRSHLYADRLWEVGKYWTSERVLGYFEHMPLEWVLTSSSLARISKDRLLLNLSITLGIYLDVAKIFALQLP
jgi:hypothetical protein